MSKNKWAKMLRSYDEALKIEDTIDPFSPDRVIQSESPYVNWTMANKSHGLPKGAGLLLYGPPKAGKSFISKSFIAQVHKQNPEAVTITFDTEQRSRWQTGELQGVDMERHIVFETKDPTKIFDFIAKDVVAMVQDGMPLGLVVIDSLSGIDGIKRQNADSVGQHLVGDKALTLGVGLNMIVPVFRKYSIPWIGTAQMRKNIEVSNPHAPKDKVDAVFAVQHSAEIFMSVRRAGAADDKVSIDGSKFEDDTIKDAKGNKEQTGHKIYVQVDQNSLGTAGRSGIITIDYDKGIINQHEELFYLGYNTGVIKREGTSKYAYRDVSVVGKANFAQAIAENKDLAQAILRDVMALDGNQ